MSLNELIDDILLIIRNSNVAESEHLSRVQIEYWIRQYRTLLFKQQIDKEYDINPDWITPIKLHIVRKTDICGVEEYMSDTELPKLIDPHYGFGIISVKDIFGNLIQLGSETKTLYQRYRRNTCKDYIAYIKNKRLYIEGGNNTLEYVTLNCILEDPADAPCFDPDGEYPIPKHLIPTIRQMILTNELKLMVVNPSDETNDSRDDNQNVYANKK